MENKKIYNFLLLTNQRPDRTAGPELKWYAGADVATDCLRTASIRDWNHFLNVFLEKVFHHIVIGQVVSGHVGEDWHIALAENLKKLHQETILRVKHYKKIMQEEGVQTAQGH